MTLQNLRLLVLGNVWYAIGLHAKECSLHEPRIKPMSVSPETDSLKNKVRNCKSSSQKCAQVNKQYISIHSSPLAYANCHSNAPI